MIADDHAAFRQVLKTVLRRFGTEFVECQDGQAAVDQCAQVRPDLVLMDIAMKPLDGLSATAQIRARFPDLPVIVVTEYNDTLLRAAADRAGACGYVLKEDLSALPPLIQSSTTSVRPASDPGVSEGDYI